MAFDLNAQVHNADEMLLLQNVTQLLRGFCCIYHVGEPATCHSLNLTQAALSRARKWHLNGELERRRDSLFTRLVCLFLLLAISLLFFSLLMGVWNYHV